MVLRNENHHFLIEENFSSSVNAKEVFFFCPACLVFFPYVEYTSSVFN